MTKKRQPRGKAHSRTSTSSSSPNGDPPAPCLPIFPHFPLPPPSPPFPPGLTMTSLIKKPPTPGQLVMQPSDSYFALPLRREPLPGAATKSNASSTPLSAPGSALAGPSRPKTPLSAFVRSYSSRPQPASNKLFVCSLTNFVDCFHPTRGRLRVGSDKWYEPDEYPEVTSYGHFSEAEELSGEVLAESVEHLILDLRYVVGDDEWDKNTEFGALEEEVELLSNGLPKEKAKRKVVADPDSSAHLPIALPQLYKITFVGSEYVEEYETRARMVAEIIESVGRHVLDVEWVTSADQQTDSIMCCSTHFVHPLIVDAGNRTWGADAIEDGLRDGGLRKFTIQGGFPIVNPGEAPSDDGAIRRKVDQSFAFKDWIPWSGVATLCWSFQGAYSQATVITVLKHLFRYVESTFVPPCAILILQHLPPAALQAISAPDARMLSRLGLDNKPRLVSLIEDLVHVESSPPIGFPQNLDELAAQTPRVVTRLWLSGYEEPEDGDNDDRQRGIRRFKADILANEHGARVQSVLQAVHSASKGLSVGAFSPPVPVSRPLSRRSTQTSVHMPTPEVLPAIEEQPASESPKDIDGQALQTATPGNLPSLSNSPMSPVISLRSGSSSSLDTVNVDEQSTTSFGENGTLHLQPMSPGEVGADAVATKSSARTIASTLDESPRDHV